MKKRHIILIGFMGSGKSTIGKELARMGQRTFLDTDEYIEEKEGKKISEIFAQNGEDYFRTLETRLLQKLGLQNTPCEYVIATGGGLPINQANQEILKSLGVIVYLKAASDIIYERLERDKKRPLLQQGNKIERIQTLLTQREPIYQKLCDICIMTGHKEIETILNEIESQYREIKKIVEKK